MSQFFNKVKQGAQSFFNKVQQNAPSFLGKVNEGINTASRITKKIGNIASQIANNPITMAIAPELSGGINALTNIGNRIGNVLDGVSHLTNQNSYLNHNGNIQNISKDALERAKKIKNNVQGSY
jgi:hypothetical protein